MASTVKKAKYIYTPLNEIQKNSKVNVFGVVKFLKQPYKTRGSDYCLVISLTDESFLQPDQNLKCLLFAKQEDLLPIAELGDVVRFHRLMISEYRGYPQGQSSPGFAWLVFSGNTDASLEPVKASSSSYQVSEEDKERVQILRQWARGKPDLVGRLATFYQVGANCYFDLICQVVSVAAVEPGVCVLLQVWDGTTTIYQVSSLQNLSEKQEVSSDFMLEQRAEGLLYDISVYDNHAEAAGKIKPGSFVKFTNLHASVHKNKDSSENQSAIPTLEFVLHGGDTFGRGVRVLSPDNSTVKSLQERLDKFTLPPFSPDSEFTFTNQSGEKGSGVSNRTHENKKETSETPENVGEYGEKDSGVSNRIHENKKETSETPENVGEPEGTGGVAMLSQGDQRCMLQTKTVVLNHIHMKKSTIQEVLEHEVPWMFRVCAKMLAYHPVPDQAANFLQLYCRTCHYLCDIPNSGEKVAERKESQLEVGSSFQGVKHYLCPHCLSRRNSLPELDSPPHLSYIFMMRFILKDSTGMLVANIWRSDAVLFFKNIQPEEVVQNNRLFAEIKGMLEEICPGASSRKATGGGKRPWIECCLRSFTASGNRNFQIFDTAIV